MTARSVSELPVELPADAVDTPSIELPADEEAASITKKMPGLRIHNPEETEMPDVPRKNPRRASTADEGERKGWGMAM
jgi:hypothetical protein